MNDDIDLERAVNDPVYRRQVIERLKTEAGEPAATRDEAADDSIAEPAGPTPPNR